MLQNKQKCKSWSCDHRLVASRLLCLLSPRTAGQRYLTPTYFSISLHITLESCSHRQRGVLGIWETITYASRTEKNTMDVEWDYLSYLNVLQRSQAWRLQPVHTNYAQTFEPQHHHW